MFLRPCWDYSLLIVRDEILGFVKHELLRTNFPRMFSLIKNEDRQNSPVDQEVKSLLDLHTVCTSTDRDIICVRGVVLNGTTQ